MHLPRMITGQQISIRKFFPLANAVDFDKYIVTPLSLDLFFSHPPITARDSGSAVDGSTLSPV